MMQLHGCVVEKPFVLVTLKGHNTRSMPQCSISNEDVQEVHCVKLFLNFVILLLLCYR